MISALIGLVLMGQKSALDTISLDFQFGTVKQVCDEITKQSGVNFVVLPDIQVRTIALKLKDRPVSFAAESIASVLGCKAWWRGTEWQLGQEKDGRPDLDALRNQATAQRKESYRQFAAELKRLGAIAPQGVKRAADSILKNAANLENSKPDGWRERRRKLLNENQLLLDVAENPQILLVATAPFTAETLLEGKLFVVYTEDSNSLQRAFDMRLETAATLSSVVGVQGDQFRVRTFYQNPHGGFGEASCAISIVSDTDGSDRRIGWEKNFGAQKVPSRTCRNIEFKPFALDGRLRPGDCIARAAASADCEYICTTDRVEAIQKPLDNLANWADNFVQQNGGAIGWKDGVLHYRHLRSGSPLLQSQVYLYWPKLEDANQPGLDADLTVYGNMIAGRVAWEIKNLESNGGPLSSISIQPFLSQEVTKLIGRLSTSKWNQMMRHVPINAEAIGEDTFLEAFFECALRRGGEGPGRAILRYVESGYSLKGLQAFCDVVPTGNVIVKNAAGSFSQVSQSIAESRGDLIVGKSMDYRFRFGYSDSESAGVSFFLRVPISQLPT